MADGTTVTPAVQGGLVTRITITPDAVVAGKPTTNTMVVYYDNGTSQTTTFDVAAGATGVRGSGIRISDGAPVVSADNVVGDIDINSEDSQIWTFDGTQWVATGQYLNPKEPGDSLASVQMSQDGKTVTDQVGRTTAAPLRVHASQLDGVDNMIVGISSYRGQYPDGWRDSETARLGAWVVQQNFNTSMRRQRMLQNLGLRAVQLALLSSTRLGETPTTT